MDPNLLKGHLDLILLSILETGPMYGLEVSKQAQTETNGYFELRVGSLYPALHRLEQAGWISGEFRPAPRGGAPVKYYWLTEEGQGHLKRKREEFRVFSSYIQALGS